MMATAMMMMMAQRTRCDPAIAKLVHPNIIIRRMQSTPTLLADASTKSEEHEAAERERSIPSSYTLTIQLTTLERRQRDPSELPTCNLQLPRSSRKKMSTRTSARASAHSSRMQRSSFLRASMRVVLCLAMCASALAFAPSPTATVDSSRGISSEAPSFANGHARPTIHGARRQRPSTLILHESLLDRFKAPKIDDPALPLSEAGIAQIVAPSLEIFFLVGNGFPYPSWAAPIGLSNSVFPRRGAFLAPTLIHGAGLACCWLAGCLAAKGFERESYEGDVQQVVLATVKAGAFATGLLILATQFDLYSEFGAYVQFGDSPETDKRIVVAAVEVVTDIFFEATTLITWRLIRSVVDKI